MTTNSKQHGVSALRARLVGTLQTVKSVVALELVGVAFDESPFAPFSMQEFVAIGLSPEDVRVGALLAMSNWRGVRWSGVSFIETHTTSLIVELQKRLDAERRSELLAELAALGCRQKSDGQLSVATLQQMVEADRALVIGWILKAVERVNALGITIGEILADVNVDNTTASTALREQFVALLAREQEFRALKDAQEARRTQRHTTPASFVRSQAEGDIRIQGRRLGLERQEIERMLASYRRTGVMPNFTRRTPARTVIASQFDETIANARERAATKATTSPSTSDAAAE